MARARYAKVTSLNSIYPNFGSLIALADGRMRWFRPFGRPAICTTAVGDPGYSAFQLTILDETFSFNTIDKE
eukprot:5064895-Heterocapsa_arctica.AAC.1